MPTPLDDHPIGPVASQTSGDSGPETAAGRPLNNTVTTDPPGNAASLAALPDASPDEPSDAPPGGPLQNAPPLALYLHIPFCAAKCPYCDFHSEARADPPLTRYVDALLAELRLWRRRLTGDPRPLISIFFGGGTPSLLPPEAVDRLLTRIRRLWSLAPDCEITLEANPDSASPRRLAGFRAAGVNRLSLGVQSFDDRRLKQLGRIHDAQAGRRAIQAARQAGFDNLGLDLIYATPRQTVAQWRAELDEAMAHSPAHLSCYELTIETGTPFAAHPPGPPVDEGSAREMFDLTRAALADGGWSAYEVSNFARPGRRCRHNLNYWAFGDYLGVGCAAHGKLTGPNATTRRTENASSVAAYMEALANARQPLTRDGEIPVSEAAAECLIMGIRHHRGLDRRLFEKIAGADLFQTHSREVDQLQQEGLIETTAGHLRLTAAGMPLADAIIEMLL